MLGWRVRDPLQCLPPAPYGPEASDAATALLSTLGRKRHQRWKEAVHSIDFSHTSRIAWSTLSNLTGRSERAPQTCPITANAIAAQVVKNGAYTGINRDFSRAVRQETADLWRTATSSECNISGEFSPEDFTAALQYTKPGKSAGPDNICPELVLHAAPAMKSWLRVFLSSCLRQLRIPRIWRRATVVAIPKPNKPKVDVMSYIPISLLCVPLSVLESP